MNKYLEKINRYFNDEIFVYRMHDIGDKYLFAIKSKNSNDLMEPMDPWYAINKNDLSIEPFIPWKNKPLFEKAINSKNLM